MKKTTEKQAKCRQQSLKELCQAVASIKNPEEAGSLLEDLLTAAELEAVIDRWMVVEPLQNDVPYRKIHDDTGVSVTTIGRVAHSLRVSEGGLDIVSKRIKTIKEKS